MDEVIIKKMLSIMEQNNLAELEYQEGERKVRLRKMEGGAHPIAYALPQAPPAQAAPATGATAAQAEAVAAKNDAMSILTSPLVGTFYRAPRPDAEPFVNVGDQVTPEKVVCIIEAMKVMNEIKAEINGIVREIRVKNGQAVEFGEPLFVIEKAS